MASAKQLRGHRARRWCTRALVVVGGAVAGTVAAWALSTTGAAADDESGDRSWPRASELTEEAREALKSGVERAADELRGHAEQNDGNEPSSKKPADEADDEANRDSHRKRWSRDDVESNLNEIDGQSLDGVGALFERLLGSDYYQPPEQGKNPFDCDGDFATEFCDRLEGWFNPGDVGDIVDELPDVDPENPDTPAPGVPAIGDGTDAERADSTGRDDLPAIGAGDSGTSERGSPANWVLAATDFPGDGIPMRVPTGAPVAPSTAGAGTAGASHADGSPQVITSILGRASAATTACEANTGAAAAPVEPGRQPGVTPD